MKTTKSDNWTVGSAGASGQRITAKRVDGEPLSVSAATMSDGQVVIRSTTKGNSLRFQYDLKDAKRQRDNLEHNRGRVKVSTDAK